MIAVKLTKRFHLSFLLVAALSFALAACASGYRDSSGKLDNNFREKEISANVWSIMYVGNGDTTQETVQTYWLYRAAELTLEKGHVGFEIQSNTRLSSSRDMLMPVAEDFRTGIPYMLGRILLLDAPLPDRPGRVFDAAALSAFLRPFVEGTKCGLGNVCPHVHRYLYPGFSPKREDAASSEEQL